MEGGKGQAISEHIKTYAEHLQYFFLIKITCKI